MTSPGFEATRPNVARVYDYLLGGCDNHQPDRQEAEALLEICPEVPVMARSNREFLGRAVTWAARQGILQFADMGSGFRWRLNSAPREIQHRTPGCGHPRQRPGGDPGRAGGLRGPRPGGHRLRRCSAGALRGLISGL